MTTIKHIFTLLLINILVMYSVYKISCPFTNEVKYIGQTTNFKVRCVSHFNDKKADKKFKWIQDVISNGRIPLFEVIAIFEAKKEALVFESKMINKYNLPKKVKPLLNKTFRQTFYKWKLDGTFVEKVEGTRQELGNVRVNRLTSKGYVWSRENKFPQWKVDEYLKSKSVNKKQVHQINKQNELIQTFDGVREAGRITGIDHRSISAVASGSKVRKTAGGYKWKYKS